MKIFKIITYVLFGILTFNVIIFGIANENAKQKLFYNVRSMTKSQIALYVIKNLELYYPEIYSESYNEYELNNLIELKVNDIYISSVTLNRFWVVLYDNEYIITFVGKILVIINILFLSILLCKEKIKNGNKVYEKTF